MNILFQECNFSVRHHETDTQIDGKRTKNRDRHPNRASEPKIERETACIADVTNYAVRPNTGDKMMSSDPMGGGRFIPVSTDSTDHFFKSRPLALLKPTISHNGRCTCLCCRTECARKDLSTKMFNVIRSDERRKIHSGFNGFDLHF
jgi:hypothetical protein